MAESQFLLLALAEGLKIGGNLRAVASAGTDDEAQNNLEGLDPSVLNRLAVVEVKQLYERRPTAQNVPSKSPLLEGDRRGNKEDLMSRTAEELQTDSSQAQCHHV
jgi:hypothetical protein